ncbi:Rv2175c family DNA-binding protein [Leucobacter salsicius]|uniref:Rv2175c family DNA-binding protein n=1 Tax=Leucobacter salsicius TaxID=664638 RepID=UPI0003470568|nr:Rv2175c family DNA-binding protein [Leucobacter salsicius]
MSDSNASETEMLTIADLVELFDASPGRIHRLIEDHYLAAVRVNGVLSVPAVFVQGNEPLPALRGTILVLLDAGLSEEQAFDWIMSNNEELGERPIDSLLRGHKAAVRRATQALAF